MTSDSIATTRFLFLGKLLLSLVFALSFRQQPLYTSNQNTYFLHGMASADPGRLGRDWLAQTADPFPLFSALTRVAFQVLDQNIFYFCYMVLLAIYCYSILDIVCHVTGIGSSNAKFLSYSALLILWYSGGLVHLLWRLPGLGRFAFVFDPNGTLTSGVAAQYLLGPVFQPSAFGVFLVLSISAFLSNRPVMAGACLAIAANFHSTYLLSAVVLGCTYVAIILVQEKNYRKAFLLGMTLVVLVIPSIALIYWNFSPTTANFSAQSQAILINDRIPHHAKVTVWFNKNALLQILLIACFIYLIRKTKLFSILLSAFLVSVLLTVIQVVSGNKMLALLFPWRISVFLVPIASAVIAAFLISGAFEKGGKTLSKIARPLQFVMIVVISVLVCSGIDHIIMRLNDPPVGLTASAQFAARTFQPDNLYLIPPEMESFRLAARVPIFVDFKSHPYKDTEVIEWYHRVNLAKAFYESRGETSCHLLKNLSSHYKITHIVLKNAAPILPCSTLHEVHRDAEFTVYELEK